MKEKTVIKTLILIPVLVMGLGMAGCSKQEQTPAGDNLISVRFSAGDVTTKSNSPFAEDARVKIFVCNGDGTFNKESSVGNIASGTSTFTGCNVDLEAATYNFYALVNAGNEAKFGSRSNKVLGGFQHGDRILAAKATKAITLGDSDVDFGNMPHLEVALCTSVQVDDAFLTNAGGSVEASVSSIEFNNCLPLAAGLDLNNDANYNYVTEANDGLKFSVENGAYNTSYVLAHPSSSATLSSSSDVYTSNPGFLLPCPLKAGQSTVTLDLTFNVTLGGGSTTLEAKAVPIPEFKETIGGTPTGTGHALYGGYMYTFNLHFNYVAQTIDLYLSVAPWESVSYSGAMGGYDAAGSYGQTLLLGSWQNVSYTLVVGGYEDDPRYLAVTPGNFKSVNWAANLGQY